MDREENKNDCIKPEEIPAKDARLRILRLLRLLQRESDVDHPMSTKMIIDRMQALYGTYMHRTTVPGDLSALAAAGFDIQSSRGRIWHFHYEDRTFSVAELKLLIDAVQASKFISRTKSRELIRKLTTLTSSGNAENLRKSVRINGRAKSQNEKGYYVIDAVNRAINTGKKLSFTYYMYDKCKEQVLKNEGRPYTVSPYDLIWDGDCYYLIGFCDDRGEIRVFRADRIACAPEILQEDAVGRPAGYCPERYTTESFRMFSVDDPVEVILSCRENMMNVFLDHFGMDAETSPQRDGTFLARVSVSVSPLFYRWVFSTGGDIRIVAPEKVREGYRTLLVRSLEEL